MIGCSDFESMSIISKINTSTVRVLLWKSRRHDFVESETSQRCGEHSRVRVIIHAYGKEGNRFYQKKRLNR